MTGSIPVQYLNQHLLAFTSFGMTGTVELRVTDRKKPSACYSVLGIGGPSNFPVPGRQRLLKHIETQICSTRLVGHSPHRMSCQVQSLLRKMKKPFLFIVPSSLSKQKQYEHSFFLARLFNLLREQLSCCFWGFLGLSPINQYCIYPPSISSASGSSKEKVLLLCQDSGKQASK